MKKELESCAEQYKEYDRKDVKYKEDIKHSKTKQKKLEDKLAKVKLLFLHGSLR